MLSHGTTRTTLGSQTSATCTFTTKGPSRCRRSTIGHTFSSAKTWKRENETFLSHIVNHYDNLPDAIVTVQGNPFPHVDNHKEIGKIVNNAGGKRMGEAESERVQKAGIDLLNEAIKSSERASNVQPFMTSWHEEPVDRYPRLCTSHHEKNLFGTMSESSRFAPGVQYVLPKESILRNSNCTYESIAHMAANTPVLKIPPHRHEEPCVLEPNGQINGWSLERHFGRIFDTTSVKCRAHLCNAQSSISMRWSPSASASRTPTACTAGFAKSSGIRTSTRASTTRTSQSAKSDRLRGYIDFFRLRFNFRAAMG